MPAWVIACSQGSLTHATPTNIAEEHNSQGKQNARLFDPCSVIGLAGWVNIETV